MYSIWLYMFFLLHGKNGLGNALAWLILNNNLVSSSWTKGLSAWVFKQSGIAAVGLFTN